MAGEREVEIRQNFTFFKNIVSSLMNEHAGKFTLIRHCKVIAVYETAAEAVCDGVRRFGDSPFSVQRVIDRPIDLGFLSHATDNGIAV